MSTVIMLKSFADKVKRIIYQPLDNKRITVMKMVLYTVDVVI